jgi:segregation and condensation protein B
MNEFYIRNVVEAALLAAGKPMQLAELGQLFDETGRPKVEDLQAALTALAAEYENRGLEVKETAAGFRIQVRKEFAAEISRLWPERPAKYSRALLETLALIAYRQPITRAEIEAVRGVAVNPNIVKTVIERNWVRVVGHRDVPGRPELLGTTREFLDYFGLRSLDELPPLADIKAMGDYNLQLELPNGADGKPEGGEGAAVALLTDGAAAGEGAVAEGAVTAEGAAVAEGSAPTEGVASVEGSAVADGSTSAERASTEDFGSAEGTSSELASGEVATAEGVDVVAQVETVEVESVMAEGGDAEPLPIDSATAEAVDDAEAERTLGAHDTLHHAVKSHAAESGESESSSESSAASESLDALDDGSDDDADEDELSADGHGSRELVAAPPRDGDD